MARNLNPFTVDELLELLKIRRDEYNEENVVEKTNTYIERYKKIGDSTMIEFFEQAQAQLLNNILMSSRSLNSTNSRTAIRRIFVDSAYRQNTLNDTSTTDFTFNLTDTVANVLSIRLHSIQIPCTWYNIDAQHGTNVFLLDGSAVEIEPGYYSGDTLASAMNMAISEAISENNVVSYKPITGKFELNIPSGKSLKFYDARKMPLPTLPNNSLGWLMGFRKLDEYSGTVSGEAVSSLGGPKSFFLGLDDFNSNHVNNGLVSVDNVQSITNIPSYYRDDLDVSFNASGIPSFQDRSLTQAQRQTLNEVYNTRATQTITKLVSPIMPNIIASIPVSKKGGSFDDVLVASSSVLSNYSLRVFFGPVNINRMRITLYDERGNVVNLNGSDWSLTLSCEFLYQTS